MLQCGRLRLAQTVARWRWHGVMRRHAVTDSVLPAALPLPPPENREPPPSPLPAPAPAPVPATAAVRVSTLRAVKRRTTNAVTGTALQGLVREPVASLHFHHMPLLNDDLRPALVQPGTHPLRDLLDPAVLRFPAYYESVAQPADLDFANIPGFVTSSRDATLRHVAARDPRIDFVASSSSSTGLLSQLYYLFSNFRPIDRSMFSLPFQSLPTHFTRAARKPESVWLRRREVTSTMTEKRASATVPPTSAQPMAPDAVVQLEQAIERQEETHFEREWRHLHFYGNHSCTDSNNATPPQTAVDSISELKTSAAFAQGHRRFVWGIDAAKAQGAVVSNAILMDLGKSMERMITMRPRDFEMSLLRRNTHPKGPLPSDATLVSSAADTEPLNLLTATSPEAFVFSRMGRMLVRVVAGIACGCSSRFLCALSPSGSSNLTAWYLVERRFAPNLTHTIRRCFQNCDRVCLVLLSIRCDQKNTRQLSLTPNRPAMHSLALQFLI
jgi:hypothetical protein